MGTKMNGGLYGLESSKRFSGRLVSYQSNNQEDQ